MRFSAVLVSLVLSLVAADVVAQTYGVGALPNNADFFYPNSGPLTIVDYGTPARDFDEVGGAVVQWASGDVRCDDAFKVKILRPDETNFGQYTMIADEGPYDVDSGFNSVGFSKIVEIEPGDVLAITQLRPAFECGGAMLAPTTASGTLVLIDDDLSGDGTLGEMRFASRRGTLAAYAAADIWVRAGMIPVAGSVAGANGSFFRTSMQLTNPGDAPIEGYLVFHPAGVQAGPDDPGMSFALEARETRTFEDVIAAMAASGLGSIDVWTVGSPLPTITTRVFNDLGAGGTLGFTLPLLLPEAAGMDEKMSFSTPGDLSKYRMNVGVRTLDRGAILLIAHFSPTGELVGESTMKEYPADYFEQVSLEAFIGGAPVAGGSVQVLFAEGSAVVYASTTDNKTNDSSVTIVSRPK